MILGHFGQLQIFDNHEGTKDTKEVLKVEFGILDQIGGRKF